MDAYYLDKKYWCIFFLTTLSDATRLVYNNLLADSIHDFKQLRKEFMGRFIQQRRYTTDAKYIFRCRQSEDEHLSSFDRRFNKSTLSTLKKKDNMVIDTFTYGLRSGNLLKKLFCKQLSSKKEMMERVHQYMKTRRCNIQEVQNRPGRKSKSGTLC